ncbi:UNKNOWN [Stylonychia lemnae]|uniref:Uncharacterized protein n=1 Tax=Stylonychia lemnae TaxID=5949 RepID=A0A078AF44_STYLE|nr:UNKNOWN [Stylonychia lemnae]|eukprot:CDW80142.1 UNKNOWN [Stylonychia lemnae]
MAVDDQISKKLVKEIPNNREQNKSISKAREGISNSRSRKIALSINKSFNNTLALQNQPLLQMDEDSLESISIHNNEDNSEILPTQHVQIAHTNQSMFSELVTKKFKHDGMMGIKKSFENVKQAVEKVQVKSSAKKNNISTQNQKQNHQANAFFDQNKAQITEQSNEYEQNEDEFEQFQQNKTFDNETPSILSNIPILQRPSLYQTQMSNRPQTQTKDRNNMKNGIEAIDEYSMNYSLFPTSHQISQEKSTFRKNINYNQDQNLHNDKNLQDYFDKSRRLNSSSETRTKFTNSKENIILQKSILNNKIYAPYTTEMPKYLAKNDTFPSQIKQQHYQRAKSSQQERPIISSNQIPLFGVRGEMDLEQHSLMNAYTEQDTLQAQVKNNMMYQYYQTDENFSLQSRPQTSQSTAINAGRSKKGLNLLQQLHNPKGGSSIANSRDRNRKIPLNTQSQNENYSISYQQAYQELKEKQTQMSIVEQMDKQDLSLIDKIQPRQLINKRQRGKSQSKHTESALKSFYTQNSIINNPSRNPYRNEALVSEQVSQRLNQRLNKTLIFKKNTHSNNEQILYQQLSNLLNNENEDRILYRNQEVQMIQDRMDLIQSDFIKNKLCKRTKSSLGGQRKNTTISNGRGHIPPENLNKMLNSSNRMEPMSLGPFNKTKKENRAIRNRDANEINHGYGHTTSPFDHPYYEWMEGLRKSNKTYQTQELVDIKKNKEEFQYQKYLSEVKSLNIVKEFLAQNKDTLTQEVKHKLIDQIINEQRRLKKIEREINSQQL